MPVRAVLLDVDGTLVDSNYHHVLAWQRALAEFGCTVACATLHRAVGMGGDRFVEQVAGARFEHSKGDDVREAHGRHFAALAPHVPALPGARELVDGLLERKLTVVLASSANPDEVERHIATVGVAPERYGGVVTKGDIGASKPSPEVFEVALERAGCSADDAFAVGDTVWDVRAAEPLGVRVVGVASGGIAAELLSQAGAVAVFDDPRAVAAALDTVLARLG